MELAITPKKILKDWSFKAQITTKFKLFVIKFMIRPFSLNGERHKMCFSTIKKVELNYIKRERVEELICIKLFAFTSKQYTFGEHFRVQCPGSN